MHQIQSPLPLSLRRSSPRRLGAFCTHTHSLPTCNLPCPRARMLRHTTAPRPCAGPRAPTFCLPITPSRHPFPSRLPISPGGGLGSVRPPMNFAARSYLYPFPPPPSPHPPFHPPALIRYPAPLGTGPYRAAQIASPRAFTCATPCTGSSPGLPPFGIHAFPRHSRVPHSSATGWVIRWAPTK
jgi:hypothetical protein